MMLSMKMNTNLNKKRLPGVFIHHSEDLIGKSKIKLYEALLSLKKKKLINKIGVSIYNFNTLDKILDEFKVDMIQVPFNILDRRLITKNYLKTINHASCVSILEVIEASHLEGWEKSWRKFNQNFPKCLK